MKRLDFSKPLRTSGDNFPVRLVAVDPEPALIEALDATGRLGHRYDGQNVIAEVSDGRSPKVYRWFFYGGEYIRVGSDSGNNIVNAPKIVKSRRGVRISPVHGGAVTTSSLVNVSAIIELTTTDGKLTNVEIVE